MSVYGVRRGEVKPSTAADNDVILLGSGQSGKRLRVIGGIISAPGGANNLIFKNKADDSVVFKVNLAAGEKVVLPYHDNWETGYFTCKADSDLEVNLSAATEVDIVLVAFAV